MCKVSKVPDRTVHSLLHTAHSNILVIFCCLLLLIQVFCVHRQLVKSKNRARNHFR